MKLMKIMLLSIISIMVILISQSAIATIPHHAVTPSDQLQSQGPGFELYNKSPNSITAIIFVNGLFAERATIRPNDKFLKKIDLQQPIQLGVYEGSVGMSISSSLETVTPAPQYSYNLNAPGKTKYLTWNPAKSPILYPQTGTFMGLSGISDSGYPLKNNITRGQISPTR